MAHSISWKTTTFEASPIATDKIGQAYAEIQKTRKATGERIASEHSMDDDEDLSGNQGRHNVGAARLFYYDDIADLPAIPTTAKAFDEDDGYAVGRAALVRYTDPDDVGVYYYKLWVYKVDTVGSAWVEPSYLHSGDVDEAVQGLKTFDEWPLVDDTKTGNKYDTITEDYPYGNPAAPDTSLVPIKAVKQALTDFLETARGDIIPLNFIYVQLPGMSAPASLWSWATWENVSSSFAGYFFRAEGGGAATFGTPQVQDIVTHSHVITYTDEQQGVSANATGPSPGIDKSDAGVTYPRVALPATTDVYPDASHTENRPANYAVRIWKRTA